MALRTAVFDVHRRLKGRLMEFGGWELPVQYTSIVDEHHAVRRHAGLFDVSHLGRVRVRGSGASAALQLLTTNDLRRIGPGQAQYSLLLNRAGGIVDDIFIYQIASEEYLVVVNAATREKDLTWMRAAAPGVAIEDETFTSATFGLQGPRAVDLLAPHLGPAVSALRRNEHRAMTWNGRTMLVARTGYTGERGIELFPLFADAMSVFESLLSLEGVAPCGLGARDTLRLEAGNRLYGQDMSEDTSPLEVGLDWVVDFEKGDFVGRDSLIGMRERGGPSHLLAGFASEGRAVPRHDARVLYGGEFVGRVTSGSYAPSLDRNIGFAVVPGDVARPGTAIAIEIRGAAVPATVVDTPFYRRSRS
ncbi:MAG: glycine cleavage system aminomethyltransferase GcvT [Chloroflexi bacterium]|nr:glycine cleavage system aminomethyltransferase GcvT [Chloroflexota bacterium]